jgi:hypothetical protein
MAIPAMSPEPPLRPRVGRPGPGPGLPGPARPRGSAAFGSGPSGRTRAPAVAARSDYPGPARPFPEARRAVRRSRRLEARRSGPGRAPSTPGWTESRRLERSPSRRRHFDIDPAPRRT